MTKRFLADASTLIALAASGHLGALRQIVGRVHITVQVRDEIVGERPGGGAIQQAIDEGWIRIVKAVGKIPGLGPGEASLIVAGTAEDVLILDDRAARLEAQSRNLNVTGLLGILVHGAQSKKLARAMAMRALDDLARGNFRMSADLYRWAAAKIDDVA